MGGFDVFTAGKHHTLHLPVTNFDVVNATLEAYLAAERLYGLAHFLHHAHQTERADVRLADIQDFRWRTGCDEFIQHFSAVVFGVFDLAIQLAVGERPRAALAELHVGFRVEHALPPQAKSVLGALAHFFAGLHDQRAVAHLREYQSREQTCWPHADDYWSGAQCIRSISHKVVAGVRRDGEVLSLIHISEPTRLGMISYAVFCLK